MIVSLTDQSLGAATKTEGSYNMAIRIERKKPL